MRLGRWAVLAVGVAAAACASTIGPVVPSIQVLVVLDSLDDTLRIIPVDSPEVVHKVPLNLQLATFGKHALALKGPIAAIGVGRVAISYNIAPLRQLCAISFGASDANPIVSLAFADNGLVFAAIPSINYTPHFDPGNCGVGEGFVRGGPRAFVSARTSLFVVTGNNSDSPSWLATSIGANNDTPLSLADSIPLSLPGHAAGAVLASDGFIYVINSGSGAQPNARLSQVNPIARTELNVIPGFGTAPQFIATDGADRIFVASAIEGLMVYNIRTNHVDRDASSAITLFGAPRGLASDDVGRVYALIAGSCGAGLATAGRVQMLGTDLVNTGLVTVGHCPVAIGVTDIPATLYHFDK